MPLINPCFVADEWQEWKFRYLPVFVGFLYTVLSSVPTHSHHNVQASAKNMEEICHLLSSHRITVCLQQSGRSTRENSDKSTSRFPLRIDSQTKHVRLMGLNCLASVVWGRLLLRGANPQRPGQFEGRG